MKPVWWLSVPALCVLLIPAFFLPSATPDWPTFYVGAKLVSLGSQTLYSIPASQVITGQFMNPDFVWSFMRPPFYALMLSPLGLFDPQTAFTTWQFVNLAAIAIAILIIWPSRWSVLITVLCAPVWSSFRQGQDMPVLLLIIAVAIAFTRKNRPGLAGAVLSLCLLKFSLLFMLPIFFIARRSWRMSAGFASGALSLLATCFAIFGPQWPVQYYSCVMENQKHLETHSLFSLSHPWLSVAVMGLLVSVCYWIGRKAVTVEMALAASLALGVLAAPRMYRYDAAISLPALLMAVRWFCSGLAQHTVISPPEYLGKVVPSS
jgi:Glycosyltransferase family 87